MQPVILTLLPNLPNFVGTYDVATFESWWLSDPLPGEVKRIVQAIWCHGNYHLCVAEMVDGTYSVFRSNDCGETWELNWNFEGEIHGLIRVEPGWMLASTSDGWWETTNTGGSWARISEGEPNCYHAVVLEDHTILAHDGKKIWKSTDIARHWTVALDLSIYWDDVIEPAIGGSAASVLASCGNKLVKTLDKGVTWAIAKDFGGYIRITDVMYIPTGNINQFMIGTIDKKVNILKFYYSADGGYTFSARFNQGVSPGPNITGFNVLRPGSDEYNMLLFASGTIPNTQTGHWEPFMKYSRDGIDWTNIDIRKTHTSPSTPFTAAGWTEYIWHGPACHNYGYWQAINHYRRGLSTDINIRIIIKSKPKDYLMATSLVFRKKKETPYNIYLQKSFREILEEDIQLKKTCAIDLRPNIWLRKTFPASYNMAPIIVHRYNCSYYMTNLMKKGIRHSISNNIEIQDELTHSYGCGIILVKSLYKDINTRIEQHLEQMWDWAVDTKPYDVTDTKKKPWGNE